MVKTNETGDLMEAATRGSGDHSQINEYDLAKSHSYTVLQVKQLSDGTKLVKIRNPWGRENRRSGAWSDTSGLWTDAIKKEVGDMVDANDGIFWMSFEDYTRAFMWTTILYDTTNMSTASFVQLDDKSTTPGTLKYYCGAKCTKHSLTFTSSVDQDIYFSSHFWSTRGYKRGCI